LRQCRRRRLPLRSASAAAPSNRVPLARSSACGRAMTELERIVGGLRTLPVDWPATPDVAARLELRPRRRLAIVAAVALAAAALAAAFAVPQSRSAILRFFHLRGVTVERVGTLPRAQELP